jgi:GAF domain-containing protein
MLLASFLLGSWSRISDSSPASLGRAINGLAALTVVLAATAATLAILGGQRPTVSLVVFGIFVIAAAALARPHDARGDPPAGDTTTNAADEVSQPADEAPSEKASVTTVAAAGNTVVRDLLRFQTNTTTATNTFVAEALAVRRRFVEDGNGDARELYIEDCWPRMRCYVEARLTDAVEWYDPADAPQLTVWTADSATGKLSFAFSTQKVGPAVTNATFDRGEGIAGGAFLERLTRNEVHPSRLSIFKRLPGVEYRYESMLVIPIYYGSTAIGVLCIDRMRAERFDPDTVEAMESLAKSLGTALGLTQWVDWFRSASGLS